MPEKAKYFCADYNFHGVAKIAIVPVTRGKTGWLHIQTLLSMFLRPVLALQIDHRY